jgi:hypothetical protein
MLYPSDPLLTHESSREGGVAQLSSPLLAAEPPLATGGRRLNSASGRRTGSCWRHVAPFASVDGIGRAGSRAPRCGSCAFMLGRAATCESDCSRGKRDKNWQSNDHSFPPKAKSVKLRLRAAGQVPRADFKPRARSRAGILPTALLSGAQRGPRCHCGSNQWEPLRGPPRCTRVA